MLVSYVNRLNEVFSIDIPIYGLQMRFKCQRHDEFYIISVMKWNNFDILLLLVYIFLHSFCFTIQQWLWTFRDNVCLVLNLNYSEVRHEEIWTPCITILLTMPDVNVLVFNNSSEQYEGKIVMKFLLVFTMG